MAAPALDTGILLARMWAQDTSTTLPGLTDAQYMNLINDRYLTWFKVVEQRAKQVVLLSSSGTSMSAIASAPTAGGTGYTLNDVLTVTAGGTGGTVTVSAVSVGVVTALTLTTAGSGYTTGAGKATTGGTGSGCTVSITATGPVALYDSTCADPEILSVNRSITGGTSTDQTAALERMEWNELRNLQNSDTTTGAPTRYALFKNTSSETWSVALHPIPDGTYALNAVVRQYPSALSGTQVPKLGDAEGYWLYRMAAADAVVLLGRPELVEGIMGPIPDAIRGKMGVEAKRLDPKRRPEESVL